MMADIKEVNESRYGYLFPHFTTRWGIDREAVWFSVSEDGLNWIDLGKKEPELSSNKGTTGIRDPFIVWDEGKQKFFMIATDLCTTKGGTWHDYTTTGSRNIVVWESESLIDWSEERLVEVGIAQAGCVWAPEAVFCKEENKWFVFWASNVKEKGDKQAKQRIYGAFTEDFVTFTPAFKFMDAETDIIDTNIVWDKGWYYRFSKDETNKFVILERCRNLIPGQGEQYEKIHSELLANFHGVEGPEAYFVEHIGKWVLMLDQYHTGKGYVPLLCDELSSGIFTVADKNEYSMGTRKKRHGSILKIRRELMENMIAHYGVCE